MAIKREKILVIGKYYAPFNGGIELVTRHFAEGLARSYDVDVLVSAHDSESGITEIDGVRVIRLATQKKLFSQPLSFGMLSKIRPGDYAGVQIHAPNPFAVSILWAKMRLQGFRTPLMIFHQMEISGRRVLRALLTPMYRDLARHAAWVSVASAKNYEISDDLPRDVRLVTLPLFIDPASYPTDEAFRTSAALWRRETYGEAPLIGFIGRHVYYKGLDVLVRALAQLPDVRAIIAGDGPLRAQTMALAQELGVADRIDFPGEVSHGDKCRIMAAIDVFAFPSVDRAEAFGLSQLEAMLLGAIVVAGDLPTGVTDISIDEETALLARPGDADHLAAQMRRALTDTALRARLRTNARHHVEEHFSRERVLADLERLTRAAIHAYGAT
jgi:rhamnosyl/mannosyltransferase